MPTENKKEELADKSATKSDHKGSSSYSAKDITVLEGLEAVRKRPGMYIGSTGVIGLHHLVWEVMDNAIDEAMAGFCDKIIISLLPDHMVSVYDNGRGIPVDIHPTQKISALEVVLTILHAGGKFGSDGYKISGGLHGVGVSVVNALSSYLKAEVHRDGKIWVQEYKNGGKPVKKVQAVGTCKDTGTTITFRADDTIMETLDYDWKTIIDHVRQTTYLSKGVHIILKDERSPEEKTVDKNSLAFPNPTYQFYFEGGIASYIRHLNHNKEAKNENIFYIDKDYENVHVEIALQYTDDYVESLSAFTNNIYNPDGGTHVQGFRTALTRSLNTYARNKNVLREKDPNLTGEDVREGLNTIISIKIREPQFEGQTKSKLGNTEARTAVETIMNDNFLIFLEEHPKDAEAIIGKCVLAAKARNAAKMARDTILRKGALEGFTLPGKLADCSSRHAEISELYIVEGDSAGGCFFGETKVALADGRNLSFIDLVKENEQGKKNFCYTVKDDGTIGMEEINSPRVTKKNTQVIKIILDNNEEIICTPNHKFMLRDGSYLEAQKLTRKDSLMPLRKKISQITGRITIEGYEMIFDTFKNKWIFTHLLADQYNIDKKQYITKQDEHRHHVNFNKLNNDPSNIIRLSKKEHLQLHRQHASKTLHRPDIIAKCDEIKRTPAYRQKISITMKRMGIKLSERAKAQWSNPEYKKFMTEKFLEFYNSNAEYRKTNNEKINEQQRLCRSDAQNKKQQADRVRNFFELHPEKKNELSQIAANQWKNEELLKWRQEKTKTQWTEEFRKNRYHAYNQTYLQHSLSFARKLFDQYGKFIEFYDKERKSLTHRDNNILSLPTLMNRFFANNQKSLIEAVINYNHKILRIEKVEKKMDVYDIEVPNTHNFALASGIFVHNSAKQGRDRETQAILPLRGKVLNVERARLDKILTNNELKSLIIAIGTNIGEAFDISKLRYHRIVIMTDADVDGAHIRTLLLTFFYRYFPQLISGGHIYIAQPPLFSIKYGKEMNYAYNEEEKEKLLKEITTRKGEAKMARAAKKGEKEEAVEEVENLPAVEGEEEVKAMVINGIKVNIQRYKGLGEMNPEQLWETTMDPERRLMKQINVEDAALANETFVTLMGDEVEPRKKFIQTYAKSVKNLDI